MTRLPGQPGKLEVKIIILAGAEVFLFTTTATPA